MRSDRKKTIVLAAAVLLVAAAAASIAGCGGSSASSGNSRGQTSSGQVTEAQLGVPIYPGATKTDLSNELQRPNSVSGATPSTSGPPPNGNWRSSAPGAGQGSSPRLRGGTRTALWTKDSTDKVVTWYRDKLKSKTGFSETTRQAGRPFGQNNGTGNGGTETVFSFKSGNTTKMVMIRQSTQNNGGTVITVADAPQGVPSAPPTNNQSSSPNGV
jgi:hypothetical protein